ncbi:MAG: [FeFe] hydrogenase H-cluster maturation GTPase HydF [Spirochaetales bacterium]|nr:[FeFe] hydrogenase H-cluster maturation GTPase HydF [Spirochaetales bacterium]
MNTTPMAEQPHIVICGLRNSGKSSLMNNLFEKDIVIVSEIPGTTTDPVTRSMELGALGAVSISDTAGFDDEGQVGTMRIHKAREKWTTADIVIFVTPANKKLIREEKNFLKHVNKNKVICAITFSDNEFNKDKQAFLGNWKSVLIENNSKKGIKTLKTELIKFKDIISYEISPLEGLVNENDLVVLVTPIDSAAPKGRLILPQVESIRDLLDKDCAALVVKEGELRYFYKALTIKPKLVVTDSQAFNKAAAAIPHDQMLTSFSILFARKKGDLNYFINGLKKLKHIKSGDKILILESCNHHRQEDDIGTVKIPRLFRQLVQPDVKFEFARKLPREIDELSLVINCAGCMITRNQMMCRINALKEKNISSINYGLFLAWANGMLPRALEPFPSEYDQYISHRR